MRSLAIWTASVAKTASGGHLTSADDVVISMRLDLNWAAGASHAWLCGESSELCCSQQNTWNRTWPMENVPMCATGSEAPSRMPRPGPMRRGFWTWRDLWAGCHRARLVRLAAACRSAGDDSAI